MNLNGWLARQDGPPIEPGHVAMVVVVLLVVVRPVRSVASHWLAARGSSTHSCSEFLLARIFWNAQLVKIRLGAGFNCSRIECEGMFRRGERHFFAGGEDFVAAVLLVPFRQSRRHVHLLDYLAPAHA